MRGNTGSTIAATWDKASLSGSFVMESDETKRLMSGLTDAEARLLAMKRRVARLLQMKPPSQGPSTLAARVAMAGAGKGEIAQVESTRLDAGEDADG